MEKGGKYQNHEKERSEKGLDPFAVLGISSGATLKEAEQARRDLMKHAHPDIAGEGSTLNAQRINDAFDRVRSFIIERDKKIVEPVKQGSGERYDAKRGRNEDDNGNSESDRDYHIHRNTINEFHTFFDNIFNKNNLKNNLYTKKPIENDLDILLSILTLIGIVKTIKNILKNQEYWKNIFTSNPKLITKLLEVFKEEKPELIQEFKTAIAKIMK